MANPSTAAFQDLLNRSATDKYAAFDFSSVEDPTVRGLLQYQDYQQRVQNDPLRIQQQLQMLEPYFQRQAERQMRYGLISNIAGSMLKDVPAAFGRAQQARFAYDPQRFSALRRAGQPVDIPNRNYFG